VPPGFPERLVLSTKEANSPTTDTAVQITRVISNLELGCNPVAPFSDFHEALAGPAGGTRNLRPLVKNVSVCCASTVFFRIPEANKQLFGPIDMTKREQILYFQLRMNLFFFFRSLRVPFVLQAGRPVSCVNSI
jgi:hypothetical protein